MRDTFELIGRIYDAAFDAALWPDVLIRLADAVGGAEVCMFTCGSPTHSPVLLAPRHDPDYVRSMCDVWLRRELEPSSGEVGQRLLGAPTGQAFNAHHLVPEEFVRTEFYNEWWRPQGLSLFGVGAKWGDEPHQQGFCFVHGPSRLAGLAPEKTKLFGVIAPHIVRAAELHQRLQHIKFEQVSAEFSLNQPGAGVIFVDAVAKVVYANDTAADLIRARDGLLVDGGELTTLDSDAAVALGRLIAGCSEARSTDGGPGGAVSIRRRERLPLHIRVAPVRPAIWRDREAWFGFLQPVAILVVNDPELERQRYKARLRKEFGLTPAETDVALEIAKGDGRNAAAERLAIAPGTLRIHLQRIFEKVGVHRQAELARLLADGRF